MPLALRIQRRLRRMLASKQGNAATVTLRWDEGQTQVDPNDESSLSGVAAAQTLDVRALVHFPSMGEIQARGFLELRAGDCIADFAPDAPLDGKSNLSFIIHGQEYAQKAVRKEIVEFYAVIVEDQLMFRTMALSLNPAQP